MEKTIEEWEQEKNVFIKDAKDLTEKMTADEFKELMYGSGFIGVNWEFRVAFLQRCGYEVNRKNMIADLPNRKNPKS